MTSRTHMTHHPRILAAAAATFLVVGGVAAPVATGEAQPPLPSATVPASGAPSAEEAAQIAAERTPDTAVGPWTADGADTTSYDPRLALSAIVLNVEGATASSPQQVALFDHGVYVGTTVPESYPYQQVTRIADNIVQVDYRFLLPGDPHADPSGTATSHYVLYPQHIERTGALPPGGGMPPVG
ncbi:LppP/LprE family lipoprotein [Corynebacterium glyciniphilum]|uniref:LppP/LprE family lipoprotein n=1 Tax=Corynebacterium glyciniphilum TaxID=1404244 RepID=UPI003DA1B662